MIGGRELAAAASAATKAATQAAITAVTNLIEAYAVPLAHPGQDRALEVKAKLAL